MISDIDCIKKDLSEQRYFKARENLSKFVLQDDLDENTESVLFDCLKAPCFLLRYEALFKIRKTSNLGSSHSVRTAIIERLCDESWLIRIEAIQFLGKYIESDKRILEELLICLKDEFPFIVDQTLITLEPYVNKNNENIVVQNCLKHKYLIENSVNVLFRITATSEKQTGKIF